MTTEPLRREIPLALLRILIGWHFLYEGWVKLLQPGWSSAGYLKSSNGPLGPLFHWLGSRDAAVAVVDLLNIWGLIGIGLCLMLGLWIRPAALGGIGLLVMYYFAYPPLFSPAGAGVSEGSYLIVNKNLVELFALAVVVAFPASSWGLQALLNRRRGAPVRGAAAVGRAPVPRRAALSAMAGVPFLGAFVLAVVKKHGWQSFEEVNLRGRSHGRDTFVSSPTIKTFRFAARTELKGRLPHGRIGNLSLSRMILGGNLIGGWAHARDLIYVSKLVKAYHHREKIFETFSLAESCGVNTVLTNPLLCGVINDYWRNGGRIQFISDCGGKDLLALIQKSIDAGACSCYIQGGIADTLVEQSRFDLIGQSLDLIRRNGLAAGIGGHKLVTIQQCVERGLRPDYWMKTLHRTDYWSAAPQPECDNIWCENPEATAEYMRQLDEPWIAFKILAAGAIEPKVGFRHAFENGADFICVGMYDFQIVEDVNTALEVLNRGVARARAWRA